MSILDISVNERNLFFKNTPTITTESRDIDYVRFDFEDTSWSEYTKFCVFMDSSEQNKISRLLEVDFKAKIPNSFLRKEEYMYIGLCGVKTTGEEITSTILIYNPAKGIFDIGESVEPPSNFYDQALENYNQILNLCNEISETYDSLMENLPFYNVKYFGAIGDGIVDDSTAIQNTINTARDAGGGVVYFPSGTYYFSKSITFASNIKLLGDTNTIFTADKDLGYDADGLKIYDYSSMRTSNFLNIGTANSGEYNGFSNVEINNIIFDLGGQWWFDDSNRLNYRAKYNPSQPSDSFEGFYSYCPIIACHGDGLRIINCTFKNGIYGGYTGNAGTNPHIMDIGGVKNILIEGCTFEPLFMTTTGISCWKGVNTTDTGMPDPINCEPIQFDACYGDGGTSGVKGKLDGTICRDIVVRNNKFYGLPNYDWRDAQNKTGDNDFIIIELNKQISNGSTTVSYDVSYAQWRFASYPAIGTCHITTSASVTLPGSSSSIHVPSFTLQPQNVEIYDNYFEGHWSSHYSGSTLLGNTAFIKAIAENNIDSSGRLLPINEWKYEPARKFCNGAIYAYPGARGYNIHNNIFKELTSYTENKSTAVFLYGSLAGIVHDNTFIDFGEPLPVGTKKENMNGINFESEDDWSSSKTGYYDGLAYCNSSNNIWIKNGELSEELSYLRKVLDVDFKPIKNDYGVNVGYMLDFAKTNGTSGVYITTSQNGDDGSGVCFDVRMFGASGGGAVDDGWAIQSAIDRCRDMGGGTIYFPKGKYNITRTLFYYSNMTFKFEEGAMIRKMTDTDHGSSNPSAIFAPYFETEIALLNNGKGTSGFASNRYAVENVVFEGGTISGYSWNGSSVNTSPSSVVLLTCLCRNIKFYNMTFDGNSGGHSIEINSSTDVTVRDCRFTGFVSSPGLMDPTNSSLRDWNNTGGMYTENIQIDAATAGAIASQLRITKGDESYKAPNGKTYDVWYKYTRDTSLSYRAIGGYFDFTLLPPGDQYNIHQDAIGEKLSYLNKDNTPLTQDQIKGMPGFHQCCHNIEIASCYFENNQDTEGGTWTWVPPTSGQNNGHWASLPNTCFVSAIGCHTSFRAINESHANVAHDKHSGIKIHDNTFIWPTNHYHGGTANDSSYWRGVIAFGTNESVSGKAFKNVHIYNVSIHGNMFYRNKDCLIDETQTVTGYAITANRDDIRYTRENSNVPQSKYKIYGNFYAGINGWENGTSSEIYKEGSVLTVKTQVDGLIFN